jgi:hypothetical protein
MRCGFLRKLAGLKKWSKTFRNKYPKLKVISYSSIKAHESQEKSKSSFICIVEVSRETHIIWSI